MCSPPPPQVDRGGVRPGVRVPAPLRPDPEGSVRQQDAVPVVGHALRRHHRGRVRQLPLPVLPLGINGNFRSRVFMCKNLLDFYV